MKNEISKVRLFSKLLRIEQWYKNIAIFLPLLFANNGETYNLYQLIIGFFGFSFVSSITYMINDWVDRKKDRLHPIKKNRPLASGKVSAKQALITGFILTLIVIGISLVLGGMFGWIVLAYFLLTNAYSFGLKNIPLLDSLMIGINFILRMGSGMKVFPGSESLPYFVILFGGIVFFLTHKRRGDIKLMGKKKAIEHKPVLKFYTKTNNYIIRILAFLLMAGSFYFLWQNGMNIYRILGVMAFLLATSAIFSKNPEYTSKPKWLFKSKLWNTVLIGNLIIFWVT